MCASTTSAPAGSSARASAAYASSSAVRARSRPRSSLRRRTAASTAYAGAARLERFWLGQEADGLSSRCRFSRTVTWRVGVARPRRSSARRLQGEERRTSGRSSAPRLAGERFGARLATKPAMNRLVQGLEGGRPRVRRKSERTAGRPGGVSDQGAARGSSGGARRGGSEKVLEPCVVDRVDLHAWRIEAGGILARPRPRRGRRHRTLRTSTRTAELDSGAKVMSTPVPGARSSRPSSAPAGLGLASHLSRRRPRVPRRPGCRADRPGERVPEMKRTLGLAGRARARDRPSISARERRRDGPRRPDAAATSTATMATRAPWMYRSAVIAGDTGIHRDPLRASLVREGARR